MGLGRSEMASSTVTSLDWAGGEKSSRRRAEFIGVVPYNHHSFPAGGGSEIRRRDNQWIKYDKTWHNLLARIQQDVYAAIKYAIYIFHYKKFMVK